MKLNLLLLGLTMGFATPSLGQKIKAENTLWTDGLNAATYTDFGFQRRSLSPNIGNTNIGDTSIDSARLGLGIQIARTSWLSLIGGLEVAGLEALARIDHPELEDFEYWEYGAFTEFLLWPKAKVSPTISVGISESEAKFALEKTSYLVRTRGAKIGMNFLAKMYKNIHLSFGVSHLPERTYSFLEPGANRKFHQKDGEDRQINSMMTLGIRARIL